MKDWRGAEVHKGDPVIYATRHSSRLDIHQGVVELIEDDAARVKVVGSTQRWRNFDKAVWVGGNYLTVVYELPRTDDTA